MVSRRSLIAAGVGSLAAPFFSRGRFRLFAGTTPEYSTQTLDLVSSSTVIDMMGLLSLNYRKVLAWQANPSALQDSDFRKLKESGTTVFHQSFGFVQGDVYSTSLRDIQGWNAFIKFHSDKFLRIDCVQDVERAKAQGKIGILVGQQNSQHFRTLADVDRFYEMGQRVSQLTYNDNRLGGGSTGPNVGLSPYGAQVVERMNKLGMAIDVSHCADRTTSDAIDASTKPVLVTHSNCRALAASARCKTDQTIRKMAAKGGVMGITMIRAFVHPGGPASVNDVLNHIDHVATIAGIEHVGLGTDVDLDGRDVATQSAQPVRRYDLDGIHYPRKIFDLTEGLVRRKYSRENIELILGKNFQRALTAIWA
ncbi:MAG TPA: membrane dipeptidase [Bryobacteraceae bacterium]